MADQGAIGVYQTLDYSTGPRTTVYEFKGLNLVRTLNVWGATSDPVFPLSKTLDFIRILPVWAQDHRSILGIPVNGQISGIVKVNGVPIADRLVRLYYRKHGSLIGSVKTDSTGTFSFINLDPNDKYTVIAFDDVNAAPDYNAKIFDILTPIV